MKLKAENRANKRPFLDNELKLFGCSVKSVLLWFIILGLLSIIAAIIGVIIRQAMTPPSVHHNYLLRFCYAFLVRPA
jgi:hypothetical protein